MVLLRIQLSLGGVGAGVGPRGGVRASIWSMKSTVGAHCLPCEGRRRMRGLGERVLTGTRHKKKNKTKHQERWAAWGGRGAGEHRARAKRAAIARSESPIADDTISVA